LVQRGGEAPLFWYQNTPSSLKFEEKTSRSPSPSRSPTATCCGPMAEASITRLVQRGGEAPLLSYQETLSSA
jgi:hypothetical protein